MTKTLLTSKLIRHALDFATGLLLFFLLTAAFSVSESGAFPAPPPSELMSPTSTISNVELTDRVQANVVAFRSASAAPAMVTAQSAAKWVLGLAFAALTALNLALVRHLHRAYVMPRSRRSVRRR